MVGWWWWLGETADYPLHWTDHSACADSFSLGPALDHVTRVTRLLEMKLVGTRTHHVSRSCPVSCLPPCLSRCQASWHLTFPHRIGGTMVDNGHDNVQETPFMREPRLSGRRSWRWCRRTTGNTENPQNRWRGGHDNPWPDGGGVGEGGM